MEECPVQCVWCRLWTGGPEHSKKGSWTKQELTSKQMSSIVPASASSWLPALTSLNDGLGSRLVYQINPFVPNLLLIMVLITTTEKQSRTHPLYLSSWCGLETREINILGCPHQSCFSTFWPRVKALDKWSTIQRSREFSQLLFQASGTEILFSF